MTSSLDYIIEQYLITLILVLVHVNYFVKNGNKLVIIIIITGHYFVND